MHPWIFSGAIKKIDGSPAEGDSVEVFSSEQDFLAMGHYQIGSIAVRIFSFQRGPAGNEFWQYKIRQAYNFRSSLGLTENNKTNVYRLVNGEGDGMPGLIIDFYNGIAVMQMHSIGMYRIRHQIAEVLGELYGEKLKAIYDKSESTLPFKANLGAKNELLKGDSASVEVMENGYRFQIDVRNGTENRIFY